ncbi:DoxX family protein [Flavobacterium sp. 7A]|uniref:DoxX family protein n=1 Tax=Flavobacterium sp. 7A TaxID=2940571 RepID=UPI0022279248|nr:DoxX family protein [Flavobacterium sp. 7A]MCW2118165.1 K+ transporter [Flavobacterium sp. 7A]
MKTNKIIYWTSTGLLCLLFLASAMMYIFNYPRAEEFFISLGFPVWIIYPLATLKILGVLTLLSKKSNFLKELAYAGFLFDVLLALTAHLMVSDGEFAPAILALIFIVTSWIYDRKIYGSYTQSTTVSNKK